MCEVCGLDFSVAFLNSEKKQMCDSCLNFKCNELIADGFDAKEITFKNIPGNTPGSSLLVMKRLPDDNWGAYLVKAKIRAMGLIGSSAGSNPK